MRPHFRRSYLAVIVLLAATPSAQAIDCTKARSTVEKTVCSNEPLKWMDDSLSRSYFAVLKALRESGDKAARDRFQAEQRAWLTKREACGVKAAGEIVACIQTNTRHRLDEVQVGGDGDDVIPPTGLRLGTELLTWGKSANGAPTLNFKGKVLIEGRDPSVYTGPAFSITDRWKSAETDAVMIQSGEAASLQCATLSVVESRKPGSVVVHDFPAACVGLEMPSTKRNEEGFAFVNPATPGEPGVITQWHAKTGRVSEEEVKFRPEPGTTMRDLASSKNPEKVEPLRNAEFFAAVSRMSDDAKARALKALWLVGSDGDCDTCAQPERPELYGLLVDAKALAYSGCGRFMYGAWLRCGESDALTVWDRATGEFYFATDEHKDDGHHGDNAHLDPPFAAWPAFAKDLLKKWQRGSRWLAPQNAD